ncbi:myoferlin-like protein [Achlya hypogyna]|uniref:Myoferlin-like protein n=1 Tax=Achlya hypogyna TaxID=1202772 RepID=A0A1V9Y5D9_ACHHY|nr:myoferlin-like protein [Achlya hypogyna]
MPLLRVKVVSGKKLLAVDKKLIGAASSDPYVRLTCGSETCKTKVHSGTVNPTWHEEFRFGETVVLAEDACVYFRVKDYNTLTPSVDLGGAEVHVSTLTPNEWNKLVLPLAKHGSMKGEASGEISVEVFYDPTQGAEGEAPPTSEVANIWSSTSSRELPVPSDEDETASPPPSAPASAPWTYNFLAVSVLEGAGLKACDGDAQAGTSDPFVFLRIGATKPFKTKVMKKTLTPKWREKFYFPLDPKTKYTNTVLSLRMEDEDVLSNDFMGLVTIDVREWIQTYGGTKRDMWFGLGPDTKNPVRASFDADAQLDYGFGKIHLAIEACTLDCDYKTLVQGEADTEMYATAEDDDEEGGTGEEEAKQAERESDEDRAKREEEQKKMMEELQKVQFKSGDYQIQVRVIEVRDLVPQDANGSADPVVFVECMGQEQHTAVKPNQLSCVFDTLLFFNLKNVDKNDIESASIEVTVKDADGPFSSDKIGFFRIDIPYIYYMKNHEMYRQWVALVKSAGDSEQGIQGYLLLSIAVLGPGDTIPIHDPATDIKEDSEMVLMPPRVAQTLHFLVVTVHRAEALPNMDKGVLSAGGIDAYVRVAFAGEKPLETRKVTTRGSDVDFQQELWFPVLLPCMSNRIAISVWDWDRVSDELVAHAAPFYFNQVKDHPSLFQQIWTNLYGSPEDSRFLKFNSAAKATMDKHPETASTYRGRLLLSFRVESDVKNTLDVPHTRNLLTKTPTPPTKTYCLRAFVISGSEVPGLTSKMHWGSYSKMSVRVTCGNATLWFNRVANTKGMCSWNQFMQAPSLELPSDLTQCPDVFVYIVAGTMGPDSRNICYARFKAADVLLSSPDAVPPPKWIKMVEDEVLNELQDYQHAGNLLLRLGLAETTSKEVPESWKEVSSTTMPSASYCLLVHLFQGRGLPAADSNGLLDPYVAVTCSGVGFKSSRKNRTRDPMYYETMAFDVTVPVDRAHQPRVAFQVYDWDRWDPDDYVGGVSIPLQDVAMLSAADYEAGYKVPVPEWFPLGLQSPGDVEGELLLSCTLVAKEYPDQEITPPASIRPKMQEKFLEIICVGMRQLTPAGFVPLHMPFLQFEIGEVSSTNRPKLTAPSAKPSPHDPNYLERIVIPLAVPEDARYAPRLNLSVYDTLLGGFHKPLLGTASIDLATKLPFSNGLPNEAYVAPGASTTYVVGNPHVDGPIEPRASSGDQGSGVGALLPAMAPLMEGMDEDDDDTPAYLKHRKLMAGTIEEVLATTPFEVYTVYRGQKFGGRTSDYRPVGKFKGLIRVLNSRSDPPLFDLEALLNPQPYVIRVYVLDAFALQPKDPNGKSDPYLRLKVGSREIVSDRARHHNATLEPKFHSVYEFKVNLPGASTLSLECWDYDLFSVAGGDDFIGATTIDLEDRWFDDRWQTLGNTAEGTFKPIETRQLYAPSSVCPQGSLRMWMDILTPTQAAMSPPVDIKLPPIEHFEVRVVVYKAKDVTPGDEFSGLSDLFIKCWMQSYDNKAQKTDIHWRAKDGKASFNWRMKFDIALPCDPNNELEKGHLHLQMWDKDVLYDDCLSDTIINLSEHLKQAYKTKEVVNVYAKPKPIKSAKAKSPTGARLPSPTGTMATDLDELERGEAASLLPPAPLSKSESQRKKSDKKEGADIMVKALKARLGMGEDPDDASWITCTTRDPHSGDRVEAGKLLLAIEILPKHVAELRAAGLGRSEPNNFPTLAEPADRLHLNALFNPLHLLESLMGPKAYATCSSLVICALVIAFLVVAGPMIEIILTLLNMLPSPYGWIVFGLVMFLLFFGMGYCSYRCRRTMRTS